MLIILRRIPTNMHPNRPNNTNRYFLVLNATHVILFILSEEPSSPGALRRPQRKPVHPMLRVQPRAKLVLRFTLIIAQLVVDYKIIIILVILIINSPNLAFEALTTGTINALILTFRYPVFQIQCQLSMNFNPTLI